MDHNIGGDAFADVRFDGDFRPYQSEVLAHADEYLQDKKIHIVAAPGAGKTVLGLELIRRLGRPALILSPTVTIRSQWVQRFCERFLPENADRAAYVSEDICAPGLAVSLLFGFGQGTADLYPRDAHDAFACRRSRISYRKKRDRKVRVVFCLSGRF